MDPVITVLVLVLVLGVVSFCVFISTSVTFVRVGIDEGKRYLKVTGWLGNALWILIVLSFIAAPLLTPFASSSDRVIGFIILLLSIVLAVYILSLSHTIAKEVKGKGKRFTYHILGVIIAYFSLNMGLFSYGASGAPGLEALAIVAYAAGLGIAFIVTAAASMIFLRKYKKERKPVEQQFEL